MKKSTLTLAALAATIGYAAAQDTDRQRPEPPAPQEVAQKMLEKHDANGDGALDADELKAAHKAQKQMAKERRRERRGDGEGYGKGKGKGPRGDGDGKGKGKGPRGDGDGKGKGPDGERPKRPSAETMIEKHDTDASGSLDESELTAMIEARREHRREGRGKRGERRGPRQPLDQDVEQD